MQVEETFYIHSWQGELVSHSGAMFEVMINAQYIGLHLDSG
jgi:hypothetical protein